MIRIFKILFFVTVSISLAGCSTPTIKSIRETETGIPLEPVSSNLVNITFDNLSPESILVEVGETVTFKNLDSKSHRIASDPHPKDDILPDLHSETLYNGESYHYTFKKTGKFGYHLEENPSIKGEVVVMVKN